MRRPDPGIPLDQATSADLEHVEEAWENRQWDRYDSGSLYAAEASLALREQIARAAA